MMTELTNPYQSWGTVAANADADARARFIRLTYLHLAGAIFAFLGLEAMLVNSPLGNRLCDLMLSGGHVGWIVVVLAFVAVSWIAQTWAQSSTNVGLQYAGLALYVGAQAVIFVPLLTLADRFGQANGTNVVAIAGFLTLAIFGGLTGIVFLTGANFSFLGTGLRVAGLAAIAVVVCAGLFGFNLGLIFTSAMIALSAGYILYDTSNVMRQYRTTQYVAAALALFASVALLFWYLIQLVMSLQSRD